MKLRVGFTFLEILLVIVMMSILIGIGLTLLDPERILAVRRDYQRQNHISNIQVAIDSYRRDNRGNFPTGISTSASTPSDICASNCASGGLNLKDPLDSYFEGDLPRDPIVETTDPLTGYQVYITTNGDIIVSAPETEEAEAPLSTQE